VFCSSARRPCLASGATPAKQQQVLLAWFNPTTKKANNALLVVELDHPPIPLKGGFGWPSNITWAMRNLKTKLSASPHNQRYVKWPSRYRSKRCASAR